MIVRQRLLMAIVALLFLPAAFAQQPPSLAELRAAVEASPDSGADWYALARALQDAADGDAALAAYQRAIALNYQPAGGWMRSAQIVAARGDTDRALEYLETAAQLSPIGISFLPQIGGVPELADDPRLKQILADAESARYPCRSREQSRQLDFWIGEWTVTNPQGQTAGESVITRDLEGCVIRESWTGTYGDRGTSVNFYDAASDRWHQVWTSDSGTVTHYEGGFRDGAMRFLAVGMGADDVAPPQYLRLSFTPNPDGTVRQLIETSTDEGRTWSTSFDGTYRRRESSAADSGGASAIEALIERTEAANNAGDVDAWVSLFADDAVYLAPGTPEISGHAGLTEVARAGFRHRAAIDIEPIEIEVGRDWAFARSRVSGTVTLAQSGDVVEVDNKQIVIYSRNAAGEWQIARMIQNGNQ